jgi:hypothetical protein
VRAEKRGSHEVSRSFFAAQIKTMRASKKQKPKALQHQTQSKVTSSPALAIANVNAM